MFFYLTVGLSLLFVPKSKSVLVGFIFFAVVLLSNFLPHLHNETLYYFECFLCAGINYTFLLGFFSYHLQHKIIKFFRPAAITILAIILFIIVPIIGNEILPENDVATPYRRQLVFLFHTDFAISRFIIWGIPSLSVFLCFLANEERLQKYRNSLLVKIGNASFTIYLIQGVVLFFYTRTGLSNNTFFAYCFCIALVALSLKIVWIENFVGKKAKELLTYYNARKDEPSYVNQHNPLPQRKLTSRSEN